MEDIEATERLNGTEGEEEEAGGDGREGGLGDRVVSVGAVGGLKLLGFGGI